MKRFDRTVEPVNTIPANDVIRVEKVCAFLPNILTWVYAVIHSPESHVGVESHTAHLSPQRSLEFISCCVPFA